MNISTVQLAQIMYYSIAWDEGKLSVSWSKQPKELRDKFVKMAVAARRHFAQVALGSEIPRHVRAQGEITNVKPRGRRKKRRKST